MKTCSVIVDGEPCGVSVHAHGMCNKHYRRWMKHGDVTRGDVPTLTYSGAHMRMYDLWGSASQYTCVFCREPAGHWAYDGTDPSELVGAKVGGSRTSDLCYSRFPEFYMPLCVSCHTGMDRGRGGVHRTTEGWRARIRYRGRWFERGRLGSRAEAESALEELRRRLPKHTAEGE